VSGRREAHKSLVGKSDERPWSRGKYDIKINLKEIGCEGVDRICLAQDTIGGFLVNIVMKFHFP
jgi:hypothetical protein